MWPFDRATSSECFRVGRRSAERWTNVDGNLALVAEYALPQDTFLQPRHVAEAVAALYQAVPKKPVVLVLESGWLPVVLADTGPTLLRAAQVEALARHRFGLHFSDGPDSAAGWELRIDHRVGSRHALAYGILPRLRQTLVEAASVAKFEWAAMTPSLAWGLERLTPETVLPRSGGWFVWTEQDRTLVVRLVAGEVVGCNAGAPPVADEAGLMRLIDAEGGRLGVESASDPIVAATWSPAPIAAGTNGHIVWRDVRGHVEHVTGSRVSAALKRVPA